MHVAIACRRGTLAPDVQEYLGRKAEKLLNYFDRVTAITVTVDYENHRSMVEILLDAEHKHNFVSQESGEDVRSTFDAALHKMEQQLRKYKEKIQDHRRTPPINEVATGE